MNNERIEKIINKIEADIFHIATESEEYNKKIYNQNKKDIEKSISRLNKEYDSLVNKVFTTNKEVKSSKEYIKDLILSIITSSIENYRMKSKKSYNKKSIVNFKANGEEIKIQISLFTKSEGTEYICNIGGLIGIISQYLIPDLEIEEDIISIPSIADLVTIETVIYLLYNVEPYLIRTYI